MPAINKHSHSRTVQVARIHQAGRYVISLRTLPQLPRTPGTPPLRAHDGAAGVGSRTAGPRPDHQPQEPRRPPREPVQDQVLHRERRVQRPVRRQRHVRERLRHTAMCRSSLAVLSLTDPLCTVEPMRSAPLRWAKGGKTHFCFLLRHLPR